MVTVSTQENATYIEVAPSSSVIEVADVGLQGGQGVQGPQGEQGIKGDPGSPTAYDLRGTGMPEGVVSAPVGTRYVDTAATNGAVEWIKSSGSGNTGWKVTHGDTGWRRLDSLVNMDAITTNTSGWSIKRRNNTVSFSAGDNTYANSQRFLTIPAGFRQFTLAPQNINYSIVNANQTTTDAIYHLRIMASFDATEPYGAKLFKGSRVELTAPARAGIMLSWETDEPWPATLPGTAV